MNSMARVKATRNYNCERDFSKLGPEDGACWAHDSLLHPWGHRHGHFSCITRVRMNEEAWPCLNDIPRLCPVVWCSGEVSPDTSQHPFITSVLNSCLAHQWNPGCRDHDTIWWVKGAFLHFLAIIKKHLLSAKIFQRCLGFWRVAFSFVIISNLQKSFRNSIGYSHYTLYLNPPIICNFLYLLYYCMFYLLFTLICVCVYSICIYVIYFLNHCK